MLPLASTPIAGDTYIGEFNFHTVPFPLGGPGDAIGRVNPVFYKDETVFVGLVKPCDPDFSGRPTAGGDGSILLANLGAVQARDAGVSTVAGLVDEIRADALCKATKVKGIYDKDPIHHDDAKMVRRISYDQFLMERVGVMDATAVALCRDNDLPIRGFKLTEPGNIKRGVMGEDVGSLVTAEG